MDWQLPS